MPGSTLTRTLAARVAVLERNASYDAKQLRAVTAPGRQAAATALERQLGERFKLDPASPDYGRRFAAARKAHFARLAMKSAKARRKATVQ